MESIQQEGSMIGIHFNDKNHGDDIEVVSHYEQMKLGISMSLTVSMNVEQIQIGHVSPSSTITKLSCSFHDHGKTTISRLVPEKLTIQTT